MNNNLFKSIFSTLSINEIIEKMDEPQRDNFLRELYNNHLRTDDENYKMDADGSVWTAYYNRYDEKSNSIVVTTDNTFYDYGENGEYDNAFELRTHDNKEYIISIQELQNRVNSIVSSKQTKVK